MSRKLRPIDGMDYVVIAGSDPNLTFGVIRRELKGRVFDTRDAVLRRLRPVGGPPPAGGWPPTCYRSDVILPPGASDRLRDPKALCDAYEEEAFPGIKDLLIIVTLRFPQATTTLHEIWEDVRGFAASLAYERQVAAILAMHVPARAGKSGHPHLHILIPARRLERFSFGEFLRPLASDRGRDIIEAAWKTWSAKRE
jgi:hypothetical protein